ncbi:MAG: PAS domain-containing protein [Candidatus Sumerlaeia bacterium]|nr:PAS domain-containing protein [Candidatus Sumerlaeia bacterium]
MKPRPRLVWRVFALSLLLAGACCAVVWVFAWRAGERATVARHEAVLETLALAGARDVAAALAERREPDWEILETILMLHGDVRLTVVRPDGRVLFDSRREATELRDHAGRAEVLEALAGRVGFAQRFSNSVREPLLYCAVPVTVDGEVVAVFRASRPTSSFAAELATGRRRAALVGLLALALAAGLSFLFARQFAGPIERMRHGAESFGRGQLGRRIEPMPTVELADLAESLNRMAMQLDSRIAEITRQRNEREAILESMREGVLAIDDEERILSMNRVAESFLGVSAAEARGKLVQEVLRIVELQRLIQDSRSGATLPGEIALRLGENLVLEARCQPLRDGAGRRVGLLVVLADVTRIRRLETMRRDFVANVSHELRTPITSIKGFAEELVDGAAEDPALAQRFAETILRQSDRLGDVIEDLLSLSRLERPEPIERRECRVAELLRQAEELCEQKARRLGVDVRVACAEGLRARLSPNLVTQAVTNLLDNAIVYGREGREVHVEATGLDGAIEIRVTDRGPGIAEEHLPRLFERFYRVDKARSRDVGGTGLGLAIVKHVAQAHGGEVAVESRLGNGSTFTIRLPDR